MRVIAVLACLTVAACATPRERCASPIATELQTVNALIAETEASINRGYTYVTEPARTRVGINYCAGGGSYWGGGGVRICGSSYNDVRRRPVAIDEAAERRKLTGLKQRQAQLQELLPQAQAACAAKYPY